MLRAPLAPGLLADFTAVLDVPAGHLAVLTGVALPGTASLPGPEVACVAEVIWERNQDVRRLNAGQLQEVSGTAEPIGHR